MIGYDVRSIDWRATARSSDVVVRTWRPERDRNVLLVLDTGRTSAGRVGTGDIGAPRLDAAMDAALLLGVLAARAGDRVSLLAYDRRIRASVAGVDRLVAAMAPLESELVETDVRGLVATVLSRTPRRSLVVLFTGLDAATVEEGLLPGLPLLTTRHHVLVASVSDPRVEEMARGRADGIAIYDAAAAERAAAERLAAGQLLGGRGVTVVDAPPDRLAPAVADAYLALKAAGASNPRSAAGRPTRCRRSRPLPPRAGPASARRPPARSRPGPRCRPEPRSAVPTASRTPRSPR